MDTTKVYILARSTGHALLIEKLLIKIGVWRDVVANPREITSDCGSCVIVEPEDIGKAKEIMHRKGVIPIRIVDGRTMEEIEI